MEVISIRKYADLKGCTEGNVRAAIRTGKILEGVSRKPDGKVAGIFVEVANREWSENYNMDRIRNHTILDSLKPGSEAVAVPELKSVVTPDVKTKPVQAAVKTKPAAQKKQPPPEDKSEPPGESVDPIEGHITIQEAKRKEAIYKAQLLEIELKEKQGSVVSVDKIRKSLFDAGAQVRSSVMAVPDRVIDNIFAAQTRNEAYLLLTTALNEALEKLYTLKVKGL